MDVGGLLLGQVPSDGGGCGAAGEAVRCACCFEPIESPDDAAEKRDSLVHKGDCEQQWGSAYDESADLDEEPDR